MKILKKLFQILFLICSILLLFACKEKETQPFILLNTLWKVQQEGQVDWIAAEVPGNIHYDLFHAGLIPDPYVGDNENEIQWIEKHNYIYETEFDLTDEQLRSDECLLVFDGIDTYAAIILNGDTIGKCNNMFANWEFSIKKYLGNSNVLRVYFESPINKLKQYRDSLPYALPSVNDKSGICPLVRKAPYHFGWDWGPRMVTMGIWRPVYLKFNNYAKIQGIQLNTVSIRPEKAILTEVVKLTHFNNSHKRVEVYINDKLIAQRKINSPDSVHLSLLIDKPNLWWPNGLGIPYLYTIRTVLYSNNKVLEERTMKYGIRNVELVNEKDATGSSFYFKVNGAPVFAKGACMIPLDNMLNLATIERYRELLVGAKECNFNMVRTWGGGIYENDVFYNLCDSLGLMVWQDFMFGNEMYYVDSSFYNSVKQEAIYNIERLRNHPSIVLWCGDNEGEWMWMRGWNKRYDTLVWVDYKKITQRLLPTLVSELDPQRSYWRSSPSSNDDSIHPNHPNYGDMHDWRVHFGPPPYEIYMTDTPRFVSEFGQQSFPDFRTLDYFTSENDRTVQFDTGAHSHKMISNVLNIHNKQEWGNQKIAQYMDYYYNVPIDFYDFAYLSQISQAEGLKIGVEHYRRHMPTSMGALFWQLNDCWPVISWSSVDYFNRWKAIQYFSKHFYAPLLVTAHIDGASIHVNAINDLLEKKNLRLLLRVLSFDGTEKLIQWYKVPIDPTTSKRILKLDTVSIFNYGKRSSFINVRLMSGSEIVSENNLYFDKVKYLELPEVTVNYNIINKEDKFFIELKSSKLVKNLYIRTEPEGFCTENYFDLLPGESKIVEWKPLRGNILPDKLDVSFMYINLMGKLKK